MKIRRLRAFIVIVPVLLAALAFAVAHRVAIVDYFRSATQPALPPAVTFEETQKELEEPKGLEELPVPPKPVAEAPQAHQAPPSPQSLPVLPDSFNLAVPFASQAPLSIWDEVHEETCEEASVLMVDGFYDGRASFDPEEADEELFSIVDFEKKQFGYFADTTAEETVVIAKKFFGYKVADVVKDPTVESIKREVQAGHPVIVPAAGRELHNPNFKSPGPIYHMVVVRGWTKDGFITNDPGTRNGKGYFYAYDVLMSAMHDWNAKDIDLGAKVALVVKPNM